MIKKILLCIKGNYFFRYTSKIIRDIISLYRAIEVHNMKEFNAYIDESGDEGIRKGIRYFVITAIIVEKEKDLNISKCIDKIKNNLEINIERQLHWNKIKGFPNKMMIMDIVSKQDLIIMNIIVDTDEIKRVPTDKIYYYYSGYLYERICWYMEEQKGVCNINISHRGNLKANDIINYVKNPHAKHNIDNSKIGTIKAIPNEKRKLLQLADCCCSALGQTLRYQDNTHLKYISKIISKYYRKNKNLLSYGIKIVPKLETLPKVINQILNNKNE